MGIPQGAMKLLVTEHARSPIGGSVLVLGRPCCSFTAADVRTAAERYGTSVSEPRLDSLPAKRQIPGSAIDERVFFRMLGADEVLSSDMSPYEDADLLLDLNVPVPVTLHNRFDLVMDAGTAEHIFHLPNVLSNIHSLLRVGGRVIHVSPASNQIDHGFYSFSPTLFYDYYTANRYVVRRANVFHCLEWGSVWTVYDYEPGSFDAFVGRFDLPGVVGLFFVAEKTPDSLGNVVPQQGWYRAAWSEAKRPPAEASPLGDPLISNRAVREMIRRRFPRATLSARLLRSVVTSRIRALRRPPLPRPVGRY